MLCYMLTSAMQKIYEFLDKHGGTQNNITVGFVENRMVMFDRCVLPVISACMCDLSITCSDGG